MSTAKYSFPTKRVLSITLMVLVLGALLAPPVGAVGNYALTMPNAIIDIFEDGDASNWFFFGGNSAGGGVLDDRPAEGSYYLSHLGRANGSRR